MNVYFDFENLLAFIHSANNPLFEQCNEFLKQKCVVNFRFKMKEDLNEDVLMWLTSCTQGMKSSFVWNVSFPPSPLKNNTCNKFSWQDHSSVYLLNEDNIGCFIEKGIHLVGKPGEEISILSELWFNDLQYTKNIYSQINAWTDLNTYMSKTSDVIIADPYLFFDPDLVEFNLLQILVNLCDKAKKAKLCIVIFAIKKADMKMDSLKMHKKQIEDKIEAKVGIKPYVTIICASSQNIGEHDRTIFTNYKMYSSGDSFNYFDSLGNRITRGRNLVVYSLADKDNMDNALAFLGDMQSAYDRIKALNNPELILKENKAKSNYLNL